MSNHADVVLSTLLGSCVAVCLWDDVARVGGLNHILLADYKGRRSSVSSVGINAMELLINALLQAGANRYNLTAKVFGGAGMTNGLSAIGPANVVFAEAYLKREGIPIRAKSVYGTQARQVLFWPATGIARVKHVAGPLPALNKAPTPSAGNGPDFFAE